MTFPPSIRNVRSRSVAKQEVSNYMSHYFYKFCSISYLATNMNDTLDYSALSTPIFCCTFCGNICEKLAKTFQFLEMICSGYSRSHFNLFLIYDQGTKLTFLARSHLAPKFSKVVTKAKKLIRSHEKNKIVEKTHYTVMSNAWHICQ